jgi:enoyl-CoA hydratase/carnithine racemase
MILTSTLLEAEQAVHFGIVHEVSDDPLKRAIVLASKMAQFVPSAYSLAKASLKKGHDMSLKDGLQLESGNFGDTLGYPEAIDKMKEYNSTPAERRREWVEKGGRL